MEDLQQRRRRPVTYGKNVRKRVAQLDEIFTSPVAAATRRAPSNKASNVAHFRSSHTQTSVDKDGPRRGGGSETTTTVRDGKQAGRAIYKRSGRKSEELGGGARELLDIQAAAQLRKEAGIANRPPIESTLRVFDPPSSGEETPQAVRPPKRKKTLEPHTQPAHPSAPTPTVREATPISTCIPDIGRADKKSRVSKGQTAERDVAVKINKGARITKPSTSTRSSKRAESTLKPAQPGSPPFTSASSLRSRVTRTNSQFLEGPKEVERNAPCGVDNTQLKKSVTKAPEAKDKDRPSPTVNHEGTLEGVGVHRFLEPEYIQARSPTSESAKIGIVAEQTPAKFGDADFNFFGDTPTVSLPRKRLIDCLGPGPTRPSKRSCSPASGESDGESNTALNSSHLSQSHPNLSPSQSYEKAAEHINPQEVATVSIQKPMVSSKTGPRITYAKERSYLAEETLDEMALFSAPLLDYKQPLGGRRRLQVESPVLGKEELLNPKRPVKNIHELRAAGEHSRFLDDIEEMLDDIERGPTISTRRTGYYEFATKLQDRSFVNKFRATTYDERLLSTLGKQTDEIICFTISYISTSLLRDDPTPRTMLQLFNNGAVSMLARMLASSRDILAISKDKKLNMSKAAQGQVADLRGIIERAGTFKERSLGDISPQLLAVKVLEMLITKCRAHGNTDNVLPEGVFGEIVKTIEPILSLETYPTGLRANVLELLHLWVSLVESATVRGCMDLGSELSEEELSQLARLLPTLLRWGHTDKLGPILLLVLRFYINITNDRPRICEVFGPRLAGPLVSLVKKTFGELSKDVRQDELLLSVDLLVLTQGLLLSLADPSDDTREAVRTTEIAAGETCIDALLTVFIQRIEKAGEADSMEASHVNVAFGYLAVLLGDLCRHDHLRYWVRSRLSGSSLTPLVGAIEEFVNHHRKVDGMIDNGENTGTSDFTARLEAIVKRLRTYG